MAVPVESEPTFTPGLPEVVVEGPYPETALGRHYDISLDDSRFVMLENLAGQGDGEDPSRPGITVILNWFEELKDRVPVP